MVDVIDSSCMDWSRKLLSCKKNPNLNKFRGPMQFSDYILRQIENLKNYMGLLVLLKGKGMQQTHINMINKEFNLNM